MKFTKFVRKNIRRTPYQAIAALMVMFLTFIIVSVFSLLTLGSQKILSFYESKPQAIAFFKDRTTAQDVKAIENSLEQTGKISNFKYVSQDEALQIYRDRNKNNPMLLELVTANILPASLEISTKSPEDLNMVAQIVKKEPVVEDVVFREDVVASLTQATHLIRVVGGGVTAFLMVFSILLIVMIIGFKIRLKRDEIEIMKLLGASAWFIRIPYILEGITYAVAGAVLAWVVSFAALWQLQPLLATLLGEAAQNILPVSPIFALELLGAELVLAVLVGGLGSLAALRRYLHL